MIQVIFSETPKTEPGTKFSGKKGSEITTT